MDGEVKKQFVIALVSLAFGALLTTVLGNPDARAEFFERGRSLFQK